MLSAAGMGAGSAADLDLDAVECSVPLGPLEVGGRTVPDVSWQQNTDRVQIFVHNLARGRNQLKVEFGASRLRVSPPPGAAGSPILDGRLFHDVDPAASYWDLNSSGTVMEIVLVKKLKREWLSLFAADARPAAAGGAGVAPPLPARRRGAAAPAPGPAPTGVAAAASPLEKLNELRRRLNAKVLAAQSSGSSAAGARTTSSSSSSSSSLAAAAAAAASPDSGPGSSSSANTTTTTTSSNTNTGAARGNLHAQMSKPPQKLDPASAAALEAGSRAAQGAFGGNKWDKFDEAAAIAEVENEGKPVAGKDEVAWRVTRGQGKGAAHHISVDEYAKDPEEIALDGELEGKMGQLQRRLQEKLRDAVGCKNRGNAIVSPQRGAPAVADWEAAGMAYLQGLHGLEDLAKNMLVILGPRLKVRTVRTLIDLHNNAALALLKLERWDEAAKCATAAAKYYDGAGDDGIADEVPKTTLVKALFRRAKATLHSAGGSKKATAATVAAASPAQRKAALADVRRVLSVAPKDKPAANLLKALQQKQQQQQSGDAPATAASASSS